MDKIFHFFSKYCVYYSKKGINILKIEAIFFHSVGEQDMSVKEQ